MINSAIRWCLVGLAMASVTIIPPIARAAAAPKIVTAKGRPHAGRLFVGVVMRVPAEVKIVSFSCNATIGGRLKRTSTGGAVYVGGTYINSIIRRASVGGRLTRATCGWRIPSSAAGKLISLAQPGCMMDCGPWAPPPADGAAS